MSKPKCKINVKKLINKYGFLKAKRKLRIYGFSKEEIFNLTAFLFK